VAANIPHYEDGTNESVNW